MEEEEGGNGSRSRKKAIKFSKYISEVQKHRLLEGKTWGTSPDRRQKRILGMASFIEKHRKTKPIVMGAGGWPTFHTHSKVITGTLFGRPITQSFPNMLTEYCRKRYDIDFKDVKLVRCSHGPSLEFAQWIHVNYTAKQRKDDTEKLYFAEVVLFKFRFGPSLCKVITCLPVDNDGDSATCKCLFTTCDPQLTHASKSAAYDDGLVSPVINQAECYLLKDAKNLFEKLLENTITVTGRVRVWLVDPSSDPNINMAPHPFLVYRFANKQHRSAEAANKYLYPQPPTIFTKMSRDIPLPKKFCLSEMKKRSNDLARLHKRAFLIAEHIKDLKEPRMPSPKRCPRIENLSRELPEFWMNNHGVELEAVNDFQIRDKLYDEGRFMGEQVAWLHMNFSAKPKNDSDIPQNFYFAEVVEIIYRKRSNFCCDMGFKYIVKSCVLLNESDYTGKSSNCGICKPDLQIPHASNCKPEVQICRCRGHASYCKICKPDVQICHASTVPYIDDASKIDPLDSTKWLTELSNAGIRA